MAEGGGGGGATDVDMRGQCDESQLGIEGSCTPCYALSESTKERSAKCSSTFKNKAEANCKIDWEPQALQELVPWTIEREQSQPAKNLVDTTVHQIYIDDLLPRTCGIFKEQSASEAEKDKVSQVVKSMAQTQVEMMPTTSTVHEPGTTSEYDTFFSTPFESWPSLVLH